jgi:hypothetical protein
MKFTFFNNRGKFSPKVAIGDVKWRCKDGHPNYETEYTIYFTSYKHMNSDKLFLFPSIFVYKWHKSVIASNETLGSITYSLGIGIEFLNRYWSTSLIKTKHTKTTDEINTGLTALGLGPVL